MKFILFVSIIFFCYTSFAKDEAPEALWSYLSKIYYIDDRGVLGNAINEIKREEKVLPQRVTILGAVRRPGIYMSEKQIDLVEIVRRADPILESNAPSHLGAVNIIRKSETGDEVKVLLIDLSEQFVSRDVVTISFPLINGDIVYLSYRALF